VTKYVLDWLGCQELCRDSSQFAGAGKMLSVRFSGLIRRPDSMASLLAFTQLIDTIPRTQLLQPTFFLLTVFLLTLLTVFLLSPCKPWEVPDRWKSSASIIPGFALAEAQRSS